MAGRYKMIEYPVWSIEPYNPRRRTTCVHISILIKKNPDMTLNQLAVQLSDNKRRPVEECVEVLQSMLEKGHLGYFDETYTFHRWAPREEV